MMSERCAGVKKLSLSFLWSKVEHSHHLIILIVKFLTYITKMSSRCIMKPAVKKLGSCMITRS